MKPEMFRAVKNLPLYEISNYGRVRSWKNSQAHKVDTPKILKQALFGIKANPYSLYLGVCLWRHSKCYAKKIHILVLEAFVGPRPEGYDACHNNGNKYNNYVSK